MESGESREYEGDSVRRRRQTNLKRKRRSGGMAARLNNLIIDTAGTEEGAEEMAA